MVCRWHLSCKGLITKEIIFCVGAQPPKNTGNNTKYLCYHCLLLAILLSMQKQFFPVQIHYSAWVFFSPFHSQGRPFQLFAAMKHWTNSVVLKWPQSWACGSSQGVLLHKRQTEPLGAPRILLFCLQSVWHNGLVHSDDSRYCSKRNVRVNAISGTAEFH